MAVPGVISFGTAFLFWIDWTRLRCDYEFGRLQSIRLCQYTHIGPRLGLGISVLFRLSLNFTNC